MKKITAIVAIVTTAMSLNSNAYITLHDITEGDDKCYYTTDSNADVTALSCVKRNAGNYQLKVALEKVVSELEGIKYHLDYYRLRMDIEKANKNKEK